MSISSTQLEHLDGPALKEVIASIGQAGKGGTHGRRYVISRLKDIKRAIAYKTPFYEGINEIYDAIEKALTSLEHSD